MAEPRRTRAHNAANARPDPRPKVRDDDALARAAARAAELRDHLGDMDDGVDEFYVDPDIIPDGWGYEWKRDQTMGKEDPAYATHIARKGWTAVPASRHPEYMPAGSRAAIIERKGMILMERPLEIIEEARDIELRKARNQMRQKEAQLNAAPAGQFSRDEDPRTAAKIKKSYEPIAIPE